MENKPPLGVSPFWYSYNIRIKELNEAIGRFIDYAGKTRDSTNYYEIIGQWSLEIKELSDVIVTLNKTVE